jgi:hypothetical protein
MPFRHAVPSQQEAIDRALEKLEHSLFWEGFEEEARAYLAAYPQERNERDWFAGTSTDGMKSANPASLRLETLRKL